MLPVHWTIPPPDSGVDVELETMGERERIMTPLTALYADKRDKVDSISGGMIADVGAGERLSRPFGRVLDSPSDIVHTLLPMSKDMDKRRVDILSGWSRKGFEWDFEISAPMRFRSSDLYHIYIYTPCL